MSNKFTRLLKVGTAGFCLMAFNTACTTTTGNTPGTSPRPETDEAAVTQTQRSPALSFVETDADTLRFYNTHTSENIAITHRPGQALSDAANWFMRDHRRSETLYPHLNGKVEYHVISAYRAPETNAGLRAAGGSQADRSLHMTGDAIDIRVPGLTATQLRDVALGLQRGGVGYYPQDNFVHVDIGRVRSW